MKFINTKKWILELEFVFRRELKFKIIFELLNTKK
jgi:hypothetical protein